MTALPPKKRNHCQRVRYARRVLVASVLLSPLSVVCAPYGPFSVSSIATAGFPESLERGGRLYGCGWGDGYHSCHSSGVRPLADLPPRSYAARVGTPQERIAGCPTCRPRMLPSVDPITTPRGPETFYHRFDQYAAQLSHREAHAAIGPVQAIIDHEAGAGMNNYRDPYDSPPIPRNRFLESNEPTVSVNATSDGSPAAPALSVTELEEFRQYQAEQRERKKFEKYLIDPDDIEPSQTFGGPPVGSEERRKLDEEKIRQLERDIQRQRLEQERARRDAMPESTGADLEDGLRSPSDRTPSDRTPRDRGANNQGPNNPAPSDQDMSMPMDSLLPPFPREEELRQDERRRDELRRDFLYREQPLPDPTQPTESGRSDEDDLLIEPDDTPGVKLPGIENILPGLGEQLDQLDSIRPERPRQTQLDFNAPVRPDGSNGTAASNRTFNPISQPQARVAEIPDWRFVKQPR